MVLSLYQIHKGNRINFTNHTEWHGGPGYSRIVGWYFCVYYTVYTFHVRHFERNNPPSDLVEASTLCQNWPHWHQTVPPDTICFQLLQYTANINSLLHLSDLSPPFTSTLKTMKDCVFSANFINTSIISFCPQLYYFLFFFFPCFPLLTVGTACEHERNVINDDSNV